MNVNISLYKTHPFFFKRVISYASLLLIISISLFMRDDTFNRSNSFMLLRNFIPQLFWAIVFGGSAIGIIVSAVAGRYRVMRSFLVVVVSVCSVWAFGFALIILLGFDISIRSIATYLFLAYTGYLLIVDPLPSPVEELRVETKSGIITKS